jgi:RNA polymerase sigma-70 factor (ECF subfamily)
VDPPQRQAFLALYESYAAPIYRYLYSRVHNAQDAEDLTAQVFLTALEHQPRHPEASAAWLFTIARNRSVDFFRRRSMRDVPLDEAHGPPGADDLAERLSETEDARAVFAVIAEFNPDERELLSLRFAGELSYAEIGECLGRNKEAVKKQIYRLLERIEKKLEVRHDEIF